MKEKILSISFVLVIFFFFLLNIFTKDSKLSYTERRKLTQFPKISTKSIMNGNVFDSFEDYALDQFVFREKFRNLKSLIQFNILKKKDNNDIFIKDGAIYKLEYPINIKKVNYFVDKINTLYDSYLKDMNVYYSIIPDKNYYLDGDYLKMDYDKLFSIVNNGIKNMKYIDITACLKFDDYYLTDTHFKQDKIDKVVNKLSKEIGFNYTNEYKVNSYEPFYGVYYGQAALKLKPDTINYLTNEYIDGAIVKDLDSDLSSVYELESLGAMDSYDVFLSGATPFITIDNPKSKTDKELVIFRDSFGSTLAPLLIEGYSKITLVDLRYMSASSLNDFITFDNQDILIIYSTLVINNSETLKI